MRILVCGADGYIGFPLTQHLLNRGHDVFGVDCFYRRKWVEEMGLESMIPIKRWKVRKARLRELGRFDAGLFNIAEDYHYLRKVFEEFKPEGIVNLAQQPSPAYSMIDQKHANFTMRNNIQGLLNISWAMRDYAPESHVVTLGTMGEYGFPHMDIPEGFFEVEFEGMKDILPFPRQTQSVYHCSKAQATDLAWFFCRVWELRATDIHQGVVYGTRIEEVGDDPILKTRFDIGECFGTCINRFVACAVIGHPIIPYGTGMQNRGYIALTDSVNCLTLAVEQHPTDEDSHHGYRCINQFDECYTCNSLANVVTKVANEKFDLNVTIEHIENPRIEPEIHYYNPQHDKLYKMGWRPKRTLEDELEIMFEDLLPHKKKMQKYLPKIVPQIKWRPRDGRKGKRSN